MLGVRDPSLITPSDLAALVTALHEKGLARETIRKTLKTAAMVLDFAGVVPNPARDRIVKLPPEDRTEVVPPTRSHVLAVLELLPRMYRLPALVLDATGMRIGDSSRSHGATSTRSIGVGASLPATRRPVAAVGSQSIQRSSMRSSLRCRVRIASSTARSAPGSAATASVRRSRGRVSTPVCRRSRRTTSGIAARRSGTSAGSQRPTAASWLGHSPQEHLGPTLTRR